MKTTEWYRLVMEKTPHLQLARIYEHEPLAQRCDELEKQTDITAAKELEIHRSVYQMKVGIEPSVRTARTKEILSILANAKKVGTNS